MDRDRQTSRGCAPRYNRPAPLAPPAQLALRSREARANPGQGSPFPRGQKPRPVRRWPGLDHALAQWRTNAIEALTGLAADSVVVTHFIVINVAVGAACGDDRVAHFSPDHCSVTRLRVEGGRLVLIERGAQARTRVL